MTAPSGQLEAGEVTAEQREAAHALLAEWSRLCGKAGHHRQYDRLARAFAECEARAWHDGYDEGYADGSYETAAGDDL